MLEICPEKLGLPSRFICLLLGFGRQNLMLGGTTRFSSARTHLRMEVRPEAPSEWPTFGWSRKVSRFPTEVGYGKGTGSP
jgi:hypothetical protein